MREIAVEYFLVTFLSPDRGSTDNDSPNLMEAL
jgi:hypothetical protein